MTNELKAQTTNKSKAHITNKSKAQTTNKLKAHMTNKSKAQTTNKSKAQMTSQCPTKIQVSCWTIKLTVRLPSHRKNKPKSSAQVKGLFSNPRRISSHKP